MTDNKILSWWLVPLLFVVGVVGCGKAPPVLTPTVVRVVETVTVNVPVPVERVPPAELLAPLTPPLPTFVPPAHPGASSALTAEGERLLRALINDLLARIAAWEAWAREAPGTSVGERARDTAGIVDVNGWQIREE